MLSNWLELLTSPDKVSNRFSPMVTELPEGIRREMVFTFGDRVTFDAAERYAYARDPSDLPRAPGPLPDLEKILKTRPYAVVRPRNRGDLLHVLRIARRLNAPVVPRGGGTSANGASVPAEGGITVDMTGLHAVLGIDKEKRVVDVEAGMHLWEMERALRKEGLSLRCYPATAPGSTVGGAIAADKAGYGSAQSGTFGDSVLETEVLSVDGKIRVLRGGELDLVVGAEGSTGFILRAKLSLAPAAEVVPLALAFESLERAARACELLAARYPVWSISLYTPELVGMRSEAGEKRSLPAGKWTVLLGATREALQQHKDGMKAESDRLGGALLDEKVARAEWENRFALWSVKKAGPSLLLLEALLPATEAARAIPAMLARVSTELKGAHAFMVGAGEMLVSILAPEDERRPEHATSLGEFLDIWRAARKHGARPYVHGILLAHEARASLKSQHESIVAFRQKHDPWDLMNPGKMLPARLKGLPFVRVGTFFKLNAPLMAMTRGMLRYRGPEKEDTSTLGMHAAIAKLSDAGAAATFHGEFTSCSSCGICNTVCPVFTGDEWESELPRGHVGVAKAVSEGAGEITTRLAENTFKCTLCGLCEDACPSRIPLVAGFVSLRQDIVGQLGALPAHARLAAHAKNDGNILGKPRSERGAWASGLPLTPGSQTLLFAGCRASYGNSAPAKATGLLLAKAGIAFDILGTDETCCGHTLLWTGQYAEARPLMEESVRAILRSGASTVVTPDAECARAMMTHYGTVAKELGYAWKVSVKHAAEALAQPVKSKSIPITPPAGARVFFLPACMRSDEGMTAAMLASVPGLQCEVIRGKCCGAGAGMKDAFPEIAQRIAAELLLAAKANGATHFVTGSPVCHQHILEVNTKLKTGMHALDAFEMLAQSAGLMETPALPAPKAAARPAAPAKPAA